jgi:hypothetical protein
MELELSARARADSVFLYVSALKAIPIPLSRLRTILGALQGSPDCWKAGTGRYDG